MPSDGPPITLRTSGLGFDLLRRAEGDDVAIVRNGSGVELSLIFNANAGEPGPNVLMDVPENYPGYTHMALRVGSIPATIAALRANDIAACRDLWRPNRPFS